MVSTRQKTGRGQRRPLTGKGIMRGKGEGSIFKDPGNGLWTGVIELPPIDGKRRRKKFRNKDKKVVLAKMDDLKQQFRERGDLPTSDETVAHWLTYWYENIAVREVRPKTAAGYRTIVFQHVIPFIGTTRLSKVTPTHIRKVTDRITRPVHFGGKDKPLRALTSTYALQVHRVMSVAFEAAVRENRMPRNPAKQMNAPRKTAPALQALTPAEVRQVFDFATRMRDGKLVEPFGARWATSLLTGARRGEVLGLEADRITDVLDLSWQLQRMTFSHGCGLREDGGWQCKMIQAGACHSRSINAPADYEYRQTYGGLYLTRPKSKAGWRIIPLVDPLHSVLEAHMRSFPPANGLVFHEEGKAIDPDVDSRRWNDFRKRAGITKAVRLHDVRHSVVDMLYASNVPEDVIVQLVGHSSRAMTRSYASRENIPRLTEAMLRMSTLFNSQGDSRSDTYVISE